MLFSHTYKSQTKQNRTTVKEKTQKNQHPWKWTSMNFLHFSKKKTMLDFLQKHKNNSDSLQILVVNSKFVYLVIYLQGFQNVLKYKKVVICAGAVPRKIKWGAKQAAIGCEHSKGVWGHGPLWKLWNLEPLKCNLAHYGEETICDFSWRK